MVDFKKDVWLYALIAFILLIIAVLTPWGSLEMTDPITLEKATIYSWMGGAVQYADGDLPSYFIESGDWMGEGAKLWTFFFVAFSAALLLFYALHSWKGMEFKWDWLVYLLVGIVLIIFPIISLVLESPEDSVISFAPIGIIIAGVVAIIAGVFDKFGDRIFKEGAGA